MKTLTVASILICALGASSVFAQGWPGTYRADINGEIAELRLEQATAKTYSGTLSFMGETSALNARDIDGTLEGQMELEPGEAIDFTVVVQGTVRVMAFANGLTLTLAPAGSPPAAARAGAPAAPQAPAQTTPEVWINGQQLPAVLVNQLTQMGLQLHPGRYWYDRMNGAWGFWGGPAMGFIAAGLPIETPMPAHASNGNTGVFVNGRQIHMQDWVLLSQLVGSQIAPGRYWIDANGYAGYEGGPAIINLVQLSQQRAAGGGGQGGGTWSSLLSSGGSDGQGNGFVQLPNGGFVTHGF